MILDENAANSVREATKIGKFQFEEFFVEKIQSNTKLIDDTTKKNIFALFEVKIQLLQINLSRRLLVFKLNVVYMHTFVYHAKDEDLDNFFVYENHLHHPSISK